MNEVDLGFDLESQLQGAEPEIEIECNFWIPPVKKNSKPMKCIAVWKHADSDERKELNQKIREKESYQLELEQKMAKYQGWLSKLESGEDVEAADGVNLASLMDEISSETEALVDWFKETILERLIRLEKFVIVGGKKVTIEEDQIEHALTSEHGLFKWDHYTQGLAASLRESLSAGQIEQARIKNSKK